jgi:hypothetical protein
MNSILKLVFLSTLIFGSLPLFAWDYEGHRTVNQLALASLPQAFPGFVRTPEAAERIAFLAGEADRWRNTPNLPLQHANEPEHYIDLEELDLYGIKPESLPIFRYDFEAQLALTRKAHPEKFPQTEGPNRSHVRDLVGLLPWAIAENYAKLKSGFSYLKAFQESGGTPEEIANAQANIIYIMGVMGHYVGDAAQPLHTTVHHHGWVGANPHQYPTNKSFHAWIDGGFFRKAHGVNLAELQARLRPAHAIPGESGSQSDEAFAAAVAFIVEQQKMVEPLYQLEKDHKLSGDKETSAEGRAFLEGQLMKGGQMLGDLWYSAWQQAPEDRYLVEQLSKRKLTVTPK